LVQQHNQPGSQQKSILVDIAGKSPLLLTALRTLLGEDERFEIVCICKNANPIAALTRRELEILSSLASRRISKALLWFA
jgi:GTPase